MSTTVQHGRAIRAINAVGGGLHLAPRLSSQALMDAAAKRTGLSDFGDEEWPTLVCVETANVADDAVVLAPGHSHAVHARIGLALPA